MAALVRYSTLITVAALLLAACAAAGPTIADASLAPNGDTTGPNADTAAPDAATSTQTPAPTPTPTPETALPFGPSEDPGLVTDTGIPVAVIAKTANGHLVRTPCGKVTEVGGGQTFGSVDVVLDPGHGGPIDTGAVGANGLVERELNLDVAKAARRELEQRGITVALTRVDDYLLPLFVRAEFADDLGADMLVSVHHNSPAPGPSAVPGTEVFVQTGSRDSRRLGELLFDSTVEVLGGFEDIAWTAAPDSGVIRVHNTRGTDAYGMIARPRTTAVLIELAYINNPSEAALMATDAYLDAAAIALADGIEAYLTTDASGSGWQETPRVFDPAFAPGQDVCVDPDLE